MSAKPFIRYAPEEGAWYVQYRGARTFERSRTWRPMLMLALYLSRFGAGQA